MDIKRTVTIEVVRSWTGPMENYDAHQECVDHWCAGREVVWNNGGSFWHGLEVDSPEFAIGTRYRAKKKRPSQGEVWMHARDEAAWLIDSKGEWVQIEGGEYDLVNDYHELIYVASSLQSYFAIKLLKKLGSLDPADLNANSAYKLLIEAAGEE